MPRTAQDGFEESPNKLSYFFRKFIDQLKALGTESCYNAKIVATGDIITTLDFQWYDTGTCGVTYLLQYP